MGCWLGVWTGSDIPTGAPTTDMGVLSIGADIELSVPHTILCREDRYWITPQSQLDNEACLDLPPPLCIMLIEAVGKGLHDRSPVS